MFSAGNRLTVQKIKTSSRRGINEKKSQISLFISAIQLFVVFFSCVNLFYFLYFAFNSFDLRQS